MFSVSHARLGSLERYVMQSGDGLSYCQFVPAFGANLLEIQLTAIGKPFQILDGFKNESQLISNEKSRNIHLLPFPNRIKDGKYYFEGKEFQLPINKPKENNAIHGFIWNKPFEITGDKCSNSSASISLKYNYPGYYDGYPYPFLVGYKYTLGAAEFSIEISVTNIGKTSMPLGIGWHPYFTFHKPADELQLQLPPCKLLEVDERMIPSGIKNEYTDFKELNIISTTTFDTAFELTGAGNESRLHDAGSGATLFLSQGKAFRYLQVYIPPDRKSIALEPMTCPANAFNSGDGLIVLKPGEKFEGSIRLRLTHSK